MSSIGRPLDLNKEILASISVLDGKVNNNISSIETINTTIGTKEAEDTPATGIFLDIQTINNTIGTDLDPKTGIFLDIQTINDTIGTDLDPKTGIFLRLQNLEEGNSMIPVYDYTGVYLILLNDLIDTADDPNVIINNTENKHLNEILLNIQKKID